MTAEQAQTRREMAEAEVVRLGELVNFQVGAVVSRTLLKRPAGTVTVFAFDEGQGLSEHTAPFDALVQVLEGSAEITVSGKPLQARTGDAHFAASCGGGRTRYCRSILAAESHA